MHGQVLADVPPNRLRGRETVDSPDRGGDAAVPGALNEAGRAAAQGLSGSVR